MKFVRFELGLGSKYGVLEGRFIREVEGDIFGCFKITDRLYPLNNYKLLAPCEPSKFLTIIMNYKDNRVYKEGKEFPTEPRIDVKLPSAVIGPLDNIVIPKNASVIYEGEMAAVIGKRAKKVSREEALDYVFGYTCINDVSMNERQGWKKETITAAFMKGVDTFAPIGPCIVDDLDPNNLKQETYLNGKLVQSSNTSNLIFDVSSIISFISQLITLMPGDVVLTGTPPRIGDGLIHNGDTVEVCVEGIGSLRNFVVEME